MIKEQLHSYFKTLDIKPFIYVVDRKAITITSFLKNTKNNTADIWKGIKQLMTLKDSNGRTPNFVSFDGNLITNPKDIAYSFNH